jgi:hypothetical protein
VSRLILLFALAVGLSVGQSFFSVGGLGEPVGPSDARGVGLGMTAALSVANPGFPVQLSQTSVAVSGLAGAVLGSQSAASRFVARVRPASICAAVPLPLRVRLQVGVDSRFSQDFDVWSDSLADTAYRRHVTGRGGIHELRAGIAWALFDRVGLGMAVGRVVGGSREHWQFESGEGAYVVTDTIEVDYSANTVLLGAAAELGRLSLGAAYEPGFTMSAERMLRVHGVVGDSLRRYRIFLPGSVRLGVGLSPASGIELSGGVDFRPWAGAAIDGRPACYRDVVRISAGAEYELAPGHPLRLGYSHQDWYFESARSESLPIGENGFHAGTSIPIPRFGSLDFGAALFLRRAGDLREAAGQLTVTLAYGEAWTRRTRRWGY